MQTLICADGARLRQPSHRGRMLPAADRRQASESAPLPNEAAPERIQTDSSETTRATSCDVAARALCAGPEGRAAPREAAAQCVDMHVKKEECDADHDR